MKVLICNCCAHLNVVLIHFKTQTDQKHHLMKKHACTDKPLTPAATQSFSSKDRNDDSVEEREGNEKNNIRKTYFSNTKGLTLYKFRRLLGENDLHKVLVCGNGYLFFILYHHCTG